ncbi:hypothetical protein ALC60_13538, partial [Trachymyrmex zeteki]
RQPESSGVHKRGVIIYSAPERSTEPLLVEPRFRREQKGASDLNFEEGFSIFKKQTSTFFFINRV